MIGLVEEGDLNDSRIYDFGRTNRFVLLWRTVSDDDMDHYHKIIIDDPIHGFLWSNVQTHRKGDRTHSGVWSHLVRAAAADSWERALCTHLVQLDWISEVDFDSRT